MPKASDTAHRLLENLAIPYVSHGSPISKQPAICEGVNTLTSVTGVLERRPGFAIALEKLPTTLPGFIAGMYTWKRYQGSFFVMLAITTNATSEVWKYEVDKDSSFILIHTQGNTTVPFTFVKGNNHVMFGNGTPDSMWKYDGSNKTRWGIIAPTIKPLCVTVDNGDNAINSSVDYHYRYTYWNAVTGHESSPSEINDCMGQFTKKAVDTQVFASQDPQVTHIRIYRTRDGGSTDPRQMQEISTSPMPNIDQTIRDYTADADLRNRFAPQILRNDPPPPLANLAMSDSRIYGTNGNQMFWSGFDEITNGVQEECFPSGLSGNNWPFEDNINSICRMAGESSGVILFMAGSIAKTDGVLRAEMRRYTIDEYHGSISKRGAFGMGGEVAWYDTGKHVRISSAGDISESIRGDLAKLDPTRVVMCPHVSDKRNWMCVLGGTKGVMYVMDMDTGMWQTPWQVNATTIHSGEIAPGERVLMAAIGGRIYKMEEGRYTDAGVPYAARGRTTLIPVAPDGNPDNVQAIDSVSIERNETPVGDIRIALDELPTNDDTYVSIRENEGDPTHRNPTKHLIERRYTVDNTVGVARRCSVWIEWPAEDVNFELYSVNVETHPYE